MKKNLTLLLLIIAFHFSYGQEKKVGIGTYLPDAQLHVKGGETNGTSKALKIENSSGTELFNVRNDGTIELPVLPQTSSTNYDILTRNKITNKIEKISSVPVPEADPIWNQARVNTKTYKGNIPSGSDLNNYLETGIYNTVTDAIAGLGQNYPIAKQGELEVFNYESSTYQTYHSGSESNSYFIRNRSESGWSSWRKLSSTEASGLERINEGAVQDGWRLIGRNNENYGNIGSGSIDFSLSFDGVNGGAKGDFSFVTGNNQSMLIAPNKTITTTFMAGESNSATANPNSGISASSVFGNQNSIGGNGTGINANGWQNTIVSPGGASNVNGYRNTVTSMAGNANGMFNYARAQAETSIGIYGTDYTPSASNHRIFNIGIGADASQRKDGFSVFRDGKIKVGVIPAVDNTVSKLLALSSDGTVVGYDANALKLIIGNTDDPNAENGYETFNTSTVVAYDEHLVFDQGEGANNNVAVLRLSQSIINEIENGGSLQKLMDADPSTYSLKADWNFGEICLGCDEGDGIKKLSFSSTGNGTTLSEGDQVNFIAKPGHGFEFGVTNNTDNRSFFISNGLSAQLSAFDLNGGNILAVSPSETNFSKKITSTQQADNKFFEFKPSGNPFGKIYASHNDNGILDLIITDGYYKNTNEPGLLYIEESNQKKGKYFSNRFTFEDLVKNNSLTVTQDPSQPSGSAVTITFPIQNGRLALASENSVSAINEGGGVGYRLSGFNPDNYGNVGLGAFDVSTQTATSTVKGATGEYSFSSGANNQASGWGAFAGGGDVVNTSAYGFAYGGALTVGGFGSSAIGYGNTINSTTNYSFTSGRNNVNKGTGSHSLGLALQTTGAGALVIGRANLEMTGQIGSGAPSVNDWLFLVGNGTINNSNLTALVRSNAFGVQANGKVTINTEPATNNNLAKLYARNDDGTFGIVTRVPTKNYSVLLSQAGTTAPTAIILENSIGAIVLSRVSTGIYRATLSAGFPLGKTSFSMTPTADFRLSVKNDTSNTVTITVLDNQGIPSDGLLVSNPLEIKVYN